MNVEQAYDKLGAATIALDKAKTQYYQAIVTARHAADELAAVLAAELKKPIIEISDFEVG